MKNSLTCLLLFLAFSTSGIAQSCYTEFLSKGISAYNVLDFESALNQFQAAKICDDAPGNTEVNDWITKTQSGYIDAIKKARDEAVKLKSEAIALRFFVKGQEREFKGFYFEAMDNYDACIIELPVDTLFRERRAQLAMSDIVAQYNKAAEDLRFLIANGNPNKSAEYNDDLAYVLEKLDDLDGAIVAQTNAAFTGSQEQKSLYYSKLGNLQQKSESSGSGNLGVGVGQDSLGQMSFISAKKQRGVSNCQLDIKVSVAGKDILLEGGRIELNNIDAGTYPYEITGQVSCNGSPQWPAIGKGTITVRPNTVYYLYWERTKYGKCDMWINNY